PARARGPPPPPAPAPVQGAPATSPASAPAQAAATQPGVAAQEERRVQATAATVTTDGDYAMVAATRPVVPTATFVTLGAGIAGLLVYVGVAAAPRRRRRVTPATVTVRSRRR
ncbi:MAG TPA: hypothetical protein VM266_10530, partial [Solirubrobacteraceae bacterium]|nr:hypothetical protein [Solirubrobacteraceae bacterium]